MSFSTSATATAGGETTFDCPLAASSSSLSAACPPSPSFTTTLPSSASPKPSSFSLSTTSALTVDVVLSEIGAFANLSTTCTTSSGNTSPRSPFSFTSDSPKSAPQSPSSVFAPNDDSPQDHNHEMASSPPPPSDDSTPATPFFSDSDISVPTSPGGTPLHASLPFPKERQPRIPLTAMTTLGKQLIQGQPSEKTDVHSFLERLGLSGTNFDKYKDKSKKKTSSVGSKRKKSGKSGRHGKKHSGRSEKKSKKARKNKPATDEKADAADAMAVETPASAASSSSASSSQPAAPATTSPEAKSPAKKPTTRSPSSRSTTPSSTTSSEQKSSPPAATSKQPARSPRRSPKAVQRPAATKPEPTSATTRGHHEFGEAAVPRGSVIPSAAARPGSFSGPERRLPTAAMADPRRPAPPGYAVPAGQPMHHGGVPMYHHHHQHPHQQPGPHHHPLHQQPQHHHHHHHGGHPAQQHQAHMRQAPFRQSIRPPHQQQQQQQQHLHYGGGGGYAVPGHLHAPMGAITLGQALSWPAPGGGMSHPPPPFMAARPLPQQPDLVQVQQDQLHEAAGFDINSFLNSAPQAAGYEAMLVDDSCLSSLLGAEAPAPPASATAEASAEQSEPAEEDEFLLEEILTGGPWLPPQACDDDVDEQPSMMLQAAAGQVEQAAAADIDQWLA